MTNWMISLFDLIYRVYQFISISLKRVSEYIFQSHAIHGEIVYMVRVLFFLV